MVQDNSLADQARHSEQLSLQQLQLAELQKIAGKISSGSATGNPAQSVGSQFTNSVTSMPTNMMAIPENQTVQGESAASNLANLTAVGGLALKSGINGINNAATVGRSALDRTAGYIDRMQNSPFFAYKSIDWTKTNAEQAEAIQMQSRHKFENAGLKVGSAFGNMGMASLGGAAGSAFGPIGTVVGTIAGSALGSVGGDQITKHAGVQQGYEKWLQQNSGRMINMFESNDGLGDGFSEKENKSLSKTLSKMNTKFNMNDDEMYTMLNQVTDAGLMKSSSDMSDFEKKFSGLVDSVKKGAKMLNTSYEEMTELYGEWNKMGFKSDAERAEITSQIKSLSGVTGMEEGASADALTNAIKQLVAGNGLDSGTASDIAQADISMVATSREKGLFSNEGLNIIENNYNNDDKAVAGAMSSGMKNMYNTDIMKQASIAAMTADESGKVSIDKEELNKIIASLESGEIGVQDVMSRGGQKLMDGSLGEDFADRAQTMTGNDFWQLYQEGGGNVATNNFANAMLNSYTKGNPMDNLSFLVNNGVVANQSEGKLLQEYMGIQGQYGDAMFADVQTQNAANMIRNDATSAFGVPLSQRIKNGWENIWQGATASMPTLGMASDSFKDFYTDTDTAMRNGYSDIGKTEVADEKYKEIFKDIEAGSEKLTEEFGLDRKKTKYASDNESFKKADTFMDTLFSPSKWDTALSSVFKGGVSMTRTDLTHDELSVDDVLKNVEKSKKMKDAEKTAMIDNINQATGQTQNMVTGSLDVVTALGGKDAREAMIDSIVVDSNTRTKTGAKNFDDLSSQEALGKLSINDQKKLQDLAVDQATKQIESQFGGNLNELAKVVKDKGYASADKEVAGLLEGGLKKGEIKELVKELMTVTQGGGGDTEMSKLLKDSTKDTAKNTKSANNNLDKANKNMEDMNEKLEELADTILDIVKGLDSRTNQLETAARKF